MMMMMVVTVIVVYIQCFCICVAQLSVVQPYSLEKYKSKEDKLQLLDDAISSHDGNAIIIVSAVVGSVVTSINSVHLLVRSS